MGIMDTTTPLWGGANMDIYHSKRDLRVVLRDTEQTLVDTHVFEIEAEDAAGRFVVKHDSDPMLTALLPGQLVLRRRDGTELHCQVSWGSLVKVGNQVRLAVRRAAVTEVAALRMAV